MRRCKIIFITCAIFMMVVMIDGVIQINEFLYVYQPCHSFITPPFPLAIILVCFVKILFIGFVGCVAFIIFGGEK